MFKIAPEKTFKHKVTAMVPVDGGHSAETFEATFRVLAPAESDKFDLHTTSGATEFLRAVVVRLDDIADAEGNPVDWNDEVRDAVLRLPYARMAINTAYWAGVSKAKAGN